MAKYTSKDVAFFMVGGYDVLGTRTALSDDGEVLVEELTPLGATDETFQSVGVRKYTIHQDGFYDDAANSINDLMIAQLALTPASTPPPVVLGLAGNTVGNLFVGFAGAVSGKYVRTASLHALHKAAGDLTISGIRESGKIHTILGANAGTPGTGTTVDNGAGSSAGGTGYVAVSSLTLGGYTNLQVKIRHSTDNITFADLVTFSVITAAPTALRLALASNATVNRYTRTEWSYNGAGAGPSWTGMAGFVRN